MKDAVYFATLILTLALRFDFYITSWGRSLKHNKSVGGKDNSRHLFWTAVDCVLDDPSEAELFHAECKRMGLTSLDEGDHIHIQTR